MGSKKTVWRTIVIVLFTLILGFVLGTFFSNKAVGRKLFLSSGNKINVILDIIDEDYVDSVNMKELVEDAIPKLISELDPHSYYIPSEDMKAVNEDMNGYYGGIGIGFIQQDDTLMVASVTPGGPSAQAGIIAGDRIVSVDDSAFVGVKLTQELITATLRGATGSKVRLGIKRKDDSELLQFNITRAEIPVSTIKVAYEVDKGIGLIKIYDKFGRTTYDEFVQALAKLNSLGCESFIIDLRSNAGGLLEAAVKIINEFLPKNRLIVYMEGKSFPRQEFISNGTGSCQNSQVVILMDQASASASEIVAGAFQDNDRGLIIGRLSYGKGLVQNPVTLSDGSALRLTVARYYTPAGRCIQRKYTLGHTDEYNKDWVEKIKHEGFSADSIRLDSTQLHHTYSGRPVYGGGSIMPDIFVPLDTSEITSYYINMESKNIFNRFAFYYEDKNRDKLDTFKDYPSMYAYLKNQLSLEEITNYAEDKAGIKKRSNYIRLSGNRIKTTIIAHILRDYFGEEAFFPVYMKDDPMILKAVNVLKKGEAWPEEISKRVEE